MSKKGKKHAEGVEGEGVLTIKVIQARNIAAVDKKGTLLPRSARCGPAHAAGTSDAYAVVTSTFNKQRFKTKTHKKTVSPQWNQEFNFFVSKPSGKIVVKLYNYDRWGRDSALGEVTIPAKQLENGDEVEGWYELEHEPKKKKTGPEKGEIRLKLHFPIKKTSLSSSTPASSGGGAVAVKKFVDEFEIGEELGRGGFSIVKRGTRKATGEVFAIKIIEKNQAQEELQLLQREIDIMRKLRHKNIIALESVYDESDYIYLVMELVTGGELFDQIVNRGTYSERDAANVVRQILEAVEYMHNNGIAHRDLKPENLLCSGPNNEVIKVTDFGLSKDFGQATLKTSCGTPDYVAPEVLKGTAYDNSVDIWSIGVISLCGFPPFYGNNDQQIFEKIMRADYDFPSPDWDGISNEAKEFISAILVLDYHKRPTAADCLEAPWIVSKAPAEPLKRLESFRGGMTKYVGTRKQ